LEERLLQCYLKYLKDSHKSDKILDFIRMLIIPMLLWLVALLLTVPSLAFSATHPYITLFCFALQLFFIYSMREYVNRFNIQNSVASFENYRQHCEELARWLRSKCKIDPESVIMQEMIPKIECMTSQIFCVCRTLRMPCAAMRRRASERKKRIFISMPRAAQRRRAFGEMELFGVFFLKYTGNAAVRRCPYRRERMR